MSSSKELLDKVVDLINNAKVEAKEQKIYILAQVSLLNLIKVHRNYRRVHSRVHGRFHDTRYDTTDGWWHQSES